MKTVLRIHVIAACVAMLLVACGSEADPPTTLPNEGTPESLAEQSEVTTAEDSTLSVDSQGTATAPAGFSLPEGVTWLPPATLPDVPTMATAPVESLPGAAVTDEEILALPEGFVPPEQRFLSWQEALAFDEFPLFWLGETYGGDPVDTEPKYTFQPPSAVLREEGATWPLHLVQIDYRQCSDVDEPACAPGRAIQSFPACSSYLATADLGHEPGEVSNSLERVDIGGEALAVFVADDQIRVFTGDSVLAIWGVDREDAIAMAQAARGLNELATEFASTARELPAPSEQALTGAGCS